MAIGVKKTKVKMNKPVYLGMSILDIRKTLMHAFCHDYVKPKYQDKAKLCYTDTNSIVIRINTEYFYKDIANDVEKSFDTSNYDENYKRPLPIGKSKKVIGLLKGELRRKIIKEFVVVRAKTYVYLIGDESEHKKAKGTKKCAIKRKLMLKNYIDCQSSNEIILNSQQRFKSDYHNVYTEQINKIALNSNDDKKLPLIKLQHICMEQMHLKYAKVKC